MALRGQVCEPSALYGPEVHCLTTFDDGSDLIGKRELIWKSWQIEGRSSASGLDRPRPAHLRRRQRLSRRVSDAVRLVAKQRI